MPRGSSPKREWQHEHIKDSAEQRGESTGRVEEIAARGEQETLPVRRGQDDEPHVIGMVAEPYHSGRGGMYMKAGEVLSVLGAIGSLASRRSRAVGAMSGAALLAASAATRWGVFHAGHASASDPKYTVIPQRERLRQLTRAESRPSRARMTVHPRTGRRPRPAGGRGSAAAARTTTE